MMPLNARHLLAAAALLAGTVIPQHATAQATQAQQRAVLAHLKSGEEPTVKDAMFTSDRMLKVGVLDNNTPRDGYASYMCQVLADKGVRGVRVQVIDIAKLVRTDKWVKLGEAGCT
jgi:hypothetical protein